MSAKLSAGSHDKMKEAIAPIHEEIGRLGVEMERIRGERAILQALAVSRFDELGLSKEAVGNLAAACW